MYWTNEQIIGKVPAVMSREPSPFTSGRYTHYNTMDVIGEMLGNGWGVTDAMVMKKQLSFDRAYAKHLIRFSRQELWDSNGRIEMVLLNSHDGKCSYSLRMGFFRMICSNGMIVGNTMEFIRFRHAGFKPSDVVLESKHLALKADHVWNQIEDWRGIRLEEDARQRYALEAARIAYGDRAQAESVNHLLMPKRDEDIGQDLWSTFNVVQERIIRGDVSMNGHRMRSIQSIDRNVAVNQGLWDLTEQYGRNAA